MDPSAQNVSLTTSVKCSSCSSDVNLNSLAEHVCGQATQIQSIVELEQHTIHQTKSFASASSKRRALPFVPRIDPFALTKIGPNGELTPASSHGSIVASPISAGSGRQSPFRMPPRKPPAMRRPPSPEPLMQDCAFPVFPTAQAKRKEAAKNEVPRGRARTPESSRSARSYSREAMRSTSVGTYQSRRRQGTTDSSRPSTASSSRRPSVTSVVNSRKSSLENVPPVPVLQPSTSHPITRKEMELLAPDQLQIQTQTSPLPQDQSPHTDTSLNDRSEQLEYEIPPLLHRPMSPAAPSVTQPATSTSSPEPSPSLSSSEPAKGPLYRSKRPPPIVSAHMHFSESHLATSMQKSPAMITPPTPSSSLARTLTGFFGRRRGQSVGSKKGTSKSPDPEGPRFMALSPDPDPQVMQQPFSRVEETAPPEQPKYQDQLRSDSNAPQGLGTTRPDSISSEYPDEEQDMRESSPSEIIDLPLDNKKADHYSEDTVPTIIRVPDLTTINEHEMELRRASIDSASSYGSIGLSHRSTSSRSTNITEAHSHASSLSLPRSPHGEEAILSTAMKMRAPETTQESVRLMSVPEARVLDTSPEREISPRHLEAPPASSDKSDFDVRSARRRRRPSTPGAVKGTCRGCMHNILGGQKSISSRDGRLTGKYHKDCFTCKTCKSPFATADFYVHNDDPYCAYHYHETNGTLCASCDKGIEGQYMETSNIAGQAGKKFHPMCLRCTTCRVHLNEDYFELAGKVYCEKDAFRLANSPKSPYDNAPTRPSPLNREYISSEEPGRGLASGRFPERRLTRLMMI